MMEQSMEMWEKMASTYMNSMFKAMERTLEQSTTFQQQINNAVSAQLGATVAAIQAVERQVETLSTKVDELLQGQE
jgi:pyrroline-5-carboxylate reductase